MRFTPQVSIPFIAGQWSLPEVAPPPPRNPRVSIPFIAGQWSLRSVAPARGRSGRAFQSPSLRGSGRFDPDLRGIRLSLACFNPLHCGAVVASRCSRRMAARGGRVSIPFIAGQWSLRREAEARAEAERRVSIPFIAGQWSLLARCYCASPLNRVSIPFIAGQWSLRSVCISALPAAGSQSPSLRGSGRFSLLGALPRRRFLPSQSPSLRGSGRFRMPGGCYLPRRLVVVSIPFIAGQWSLQVRYPGRMMLFLLSQSPSLRGSGRFFSHLAVALTLYLSQSPSLRGSGRFQGAGLVHGIVYARLNPLHCGAVVASTPAPPARMRARRVSIPFIAGQWSLRRKRAHGGKRSAGSQSPSLRGSGRFFAHAVGTSQQSEGVSIPFIAGQWSLPYP